jgi:hypothetical protein
MRTPVFSTQEKKRAVGWFRKSSVNMKDKMQPFMKAGIAIVIAGFLLSWEVIFGSNYRLTPEVLHQTITDSAHLSQIEPATQSMMGKVYGSNIDFVSDFKKSDQYSQ